jgi:hypothetical protein
MLIDLLPDPPAWAVISGILAWDVGFLWVIWRWSQRPEKRHRFKPPVSGGDRRRPARHWLTGPDPEKVVRVDRDADLW